VSAEGLVLAASSGARVRARRFVHGGGALQTREPRRLVELVSLGTRVEHQLGTYRVEQLAELGDRELVPAGKPAFTLPAAEVRRLLAWASGADDATGDACILLAGGEPETARLRVSLSQLSLRLEQHEDARRALALIECDTPDLLVVAPGLQSGGELDLVRAARRLRGPDELPILLVGADEAAALEAGADRQLDDLRSARAFVDLVAELLELV
jgi:hypothetical protein